MGTLYKSRSTLSRDSCAASLQRALNDLMASIASSGRFCCFITMAMSFRALSTRSLALMAFQKRTMARSGSLSTSWGGGREREGAREGNGNDRLGGWGG